MGTIENDDDSEKNPENSKVDKSINMVLSHGCQDDSGTPTTCNSENPLVTPPQVEK